MKHNKKKHLKKKNNIKKTSKSSSVITFVCLLALIIATGSSIFFGYNQYLYSGCTKQIDETVNFKQNFIDSIPAAPYRTEETYRINSVTHSEYNPEYDMETYSVKANFSSSPYHFGLDDSLTKLIQTCPTPSEENTTFVEFSKRQENMIQSARNLVVQYIKTSDILKDKDRLIEAVQNVPFYLYKNSELLSLNVEWVPAQTHENAIYCNKLYDYAFCEAMFVHELVHHLQHTARQTPYTEYTGTKYDEALVEMITDSMNPKDYTNVEVEYEIYIEPMKKYISLFGAENVLEAFFYGYEDFFASNSDHLSEDEHDAFAQIIGTYGAHPKGYELVEGFFGTWYDRLHA